MTIGCIVINNRMNAYGCREELVLFLSVLKWVFLATIIGWMTGFAASGFIKLIHYIIEQSNEYESVFYLLPLSFFTANVLSQFVLKRHLGTDALIAAINNNYGRIEGSFIPTKVINVMLILGTGGSAGKESPCAQIGAGLGSLCAGVLKVDDIDRRKMVLCGFCAGKGCWLTSGIRCILLLTLFWPARSTNVVPAEGTVRDKMKARCPSCRQDGQRAGGF